MDFELAADQRAEPDEQYPNRKKAPDCWKFVRIVREKLRENWPRQRMKHNESPSAVRERHQEHREHVGWKTALDPDPIFERNKQAVIGDVPSDMPVARYQAKGLSAQR